MSLGQRWQIELERLKAEGRYRMLTPPRGIDFSSNDYLGYARKTWPAALESRSGTASRLLRGHQPIWDEVESRLAAWHKTEAALMITSGYAANEGLLGTIAQAGDTVFSDQYNHASIIDGLRLSRAEKLVFAHNDLADLAARLHQGKPNRRAEQAWFIVTESLFGMEGDRAPLRDMADLAERFNAHLIVDEAHATGCFGPTGSGIVDELGLREHVLATVHTGGKALAVPGAYIAGSRLLKDMLVNRCRHFIFTTALPPAIAAWWLEALDLVQPDDATRDALCERVRFFREEMAKQGIPVGGTEQIATIVLGPDAAAVAAANRLQEAGYDIRAIRPPTVPQGAARLRISIHADHQLGTLANLAEMLGTPNP